MMMRRLSIGVLLCAFTLAALPASAHAQAASHPQSASLVLRPVAIEPYDPLADAEAEVAQSGGRHTKRGAIIGGSLGALGGLGMGVFISLFCEAETGDDCTAAIPLLTLLGAGAGAGIGALIGAAIPRGAAEPDTVPVPTEPATAAVETQRRRIGSATLSVGAVGARSGELDSAVRPDWERGVAVRFNFFAELGSWFALGPQFGHAWLGSDATVRHASIAMRGSYVRPRFAPYVVADVGVYQTRLPFQSQDGYEYQNSLEFLGGSFGAGTRIFPFSSPRVFLDVDARWHRHLQNIAPFDMTALSVGLGGVW